MEYCLAGPQVPHFDPVRAGRDKPFAIAGGSQIADAMQSWVSAERQIFFAHFQVPHFDLLPLHISRKDSSSIRSKRQTGHTPVVAAESECFFPALQVPYLDGAVSAAGKQAFAVLRKDQVIYCIIMTANGAVFPAHLQIGDFDRSIDARREQS